MSLHRYVVRYEMIIEYTDCTHVVYFFTHATYHHWAVLVVHKYKERNECIRGMGVFWHFEGFLEHFWKHLGLFKWKHMKFVVLWRGLASRTSVIFVLCDTGCLHTPSLLKRPMPQKHKMKWRYCAANAELYQHHFHFQ